MNYYHSYINPYHLNPYPYSHSSHGDMNNWHRQQPISGQATWTDGGRITQCGIPWSNNRYMTVAVSQQSPYRCGQTLKVKNVTTQREIIVTVVDKVSGFPANRINLHRRAFETLGANLNVGVINVQITPSPELEQEKWGKYLLEIVQTAYPSYNVVDYQALGEEQVSTNQTKETFNYVLQSQQETIRVQGNVIYNPNTDRIISFDLNELS